MADQIPDKLFFKIGEVARIAGVKTHVLRYWETEFGTLKPVKSNTNQRLYRRKDVETALLIKELLYQQGFTIAGAKKKLQDNNATLEPASPLPPSDRQLLQQIRSDLQRLKNRLSPEGTD